MVIYPVQELFYAWNVFQMTSKNPSLTKKYLVLAREEMPAVKGIKGMLVNLFLVSQFFFVYLVRLAQSYTTQRAKEINEPIVSSFVCHFRRQ